MKMTKFGIIFETFFGILMCSIKLSICEATIEAPSVNLTAKRCGIQEIQPLITMMYRIVGGDEARKHSWPWMVSIEKYEDEESTHFCGGSLVARNKVLTAAHCFKGITENNKLKIKLGLHSKDDPIDYKKIIEIDVKDFEIHENYDFNASSSQYDIALLTLQHPVSYTGWISPICIGAKLQLSVNSTCFVTGWGSTMNQGGNSVDLLQLRLPILDDEICVKVNPKANATTQFCGGYLEGEHDSCQGDSGGPVVCQDTDDSPWRIHGIVSYGNSCAKKGKLGVYTRVSFFRLWLADHINT